MSDSPPPAKPKVGSLRDRIAAFEKPAAAPASGPPPPRPKPGHLSGWKPRERSPPPAGGGEATDTTHDTKNTGGMSASDAKQAIGAGGSLKERMAALQGRGAFGGVGGGASAPPHPATERPKWKPPPKVASPPPDDDDAADSVKSSEMAKSPPLPTPGSVKSPASEVLTTPDVREESSAVVIPEGEEGEPKEVDPEEEERARRATIAARMARLGGARVGMGPPIFGKKPPPPKPTTALQEEPTATLPVATPPAAAISQGSSEAPNILQTPEAIVGTPADDGAASATNQGTGSQDNYFPAQPTRKDSAASSLLSADSPAAPAKSPGSMPLPAAPRRAAPPRRKPAKSPSPAPPAASIAESTQEPPSEVLSEETPSIAVAPDAATAQPEGGSGKTDDAESVAADQNAGEETGTPEVPAVEAEEPQVEAKAETDKIETEEVQESSLEQPLAHEVANETTSDEPADSTKPTGEVEDSDLAQTPDDAVQPASPETEKPVLSVHQEDIIPGPATEVAHPQNEVAELEADPEPIAGAEVPAHREPVQEPESAPAEVTPTELETVEEPSAAMETTPVEEEDDEAARRQRVAARLAKMGGFNPFGGGVPPTRSSTMSSRHSAQDTSAAIAPEPSHDGAGHIEEPDAPEPEITLPQAGEDEHSDEEDEESDYSQEVAGSPPSVPPPIPSATRPAKRPSEDIVEDEVAKSPSPPITRRSMPPPPRTAPPPPVPVASPEEELVDEPEGEDTAPLTAVEDDAEEQEQSEEYEEENPAFAVSTDHKPGFSRPPAPPLISTTSGPGEVLDDDEGDPIDPGFHSPRRTSPEAQSAPIISPAQPSLPTPTLPPENAKVEEDPEVQRRRTIAERMAKLGGIKFGAAPPPPKPRISAPSQEEDAPQEGAQGIPEQPLTEEEEEFARKQRIAAKLAGMGGMRIGMLPPGMGGLPPQPKPRREESDDTISSPPPPPPQRPTGRPPNRPPPPPQALETDSEFESVGNATSDDGVQVELQESEPEDVAAEEASEGEAPPPVPSRASRPPVPSVLSSVSARRVSTQESKRSSKDSSMISPPARHAPSEYVMVEEPESSDISPPPPPRSARSPPARAVPAPRPELSRGQSSQWELPAIPTSTLEFEDEGGDLSASVQSEDSTSYPLPEPVVSPPAPPAPTKQVVDIPVQMSSEQLMSVWGKVGMMVHEVAASLYDKSKKSLIGDGTYEGFIHATFAQVPGARMPSSSYGYLIYSQTSNSVQRRVTDIMPGDIVVVEQAKLAGRKGLQSYHQDIQGSLVGIVGEFDQKKSKLKVYQANQHVGQQTVESVSYRFEDLKSGTINVYRALEA